MSLASFTWFVSRPCTLISSTRQQWHTCLHIGENPAIFFPRSCPLHPSFKQMMSFGHSKLSSFKSTRSSLPTQISSKLDPTYIVACAANVILIAEYARMNGSQLISGRRNSAWPWILRYTIVDRYVSPSAMFWMGKPMFCPRADLCGIFWRVSWRKLRGLVSARSMAWRWMRWRHCCTVFARLVVSFWSLQMFCVSCMPVILKCSSRCAATSAGMRYPMSPTLCSAESAIAVSMVMVPLR
jgi:hypothetical protein